MHLTKLTLTYLVSSSPFIAVPSMRCLSDCCFKYFLTFWHTSLSSPVSADAEGLSDADFNTSWRGGKTMGLSSNLSLLRLGMSPRARGNFAILFFVMARNLREVMRLMPSGITSMEFLLISRISSLESCRICAPAISSKDRTYTLEAHTYRLWEDFEPVPSNIEIAQAVALHDLIWYRALWIMRERKPVPSQPAPPLQTCLRSYRSTLSCINPITSNGNAGICLPLRSSVTPDADALGGTPAFEACI